MPSHAIQLRRHTLGTGWRRSPNTLLPIALPSSLSGVRRRHTLAGAGTTAATVGVAAVASTINGLSVGVVGAILGYTLSKKGSQRKNARKWFFWSGGVTAALTVALFGVAIAGAPE